MFGVGLAISIISTGLLWFDVLRRVDELTVTRSDNTQWTISQLEVDTLRFSLAIAAAETGDAVALKALRQRFDIFYSRLRTLGRAESYQLLFDDPDYVAAHRQIDAFLNRQLPFIDGSDAALRAALPQMTREAADAHLAVRALALRGLQVFATVSDRQRSEVVVLIMRTGLVTVLLLAVLAVVLLLMLQTNRRAAAAARRTAEANRNLAMIVNTSLDAIVLADDKGVVQTFNPAAEEIFGWTQAEALGRPMTELMIPEHHHAAHDAGMKRYLETGTMRVIGTGRVQLDARHKSGRIFPVELSLSTEQDDTGRTFVGFLRDITKRREAEDALTAARDDALAAARKKAEFLAVMSHEIRTPLNGMLGAIDLMGDGALDPQQRRWLTTLRGSGQLLLRHVNDVLDLSRLDADQAGLFEESVDLRALCGEVLESQSSAARAAGNVLASEIAPEVPGVVGTDGRRLSQVLLNLVGNANKFTRGGAVRLSIRAQDAPEGRIMLDIHVTDTGIGVPADDRDRIFEEFVMLNSSYGRGATGTGLGLAISRRIVQAMGGEIDVHDAPGGGADFRIRLAVKAVADAPDLAVDSVATPDQDGARTLRILVVEDNAINREILGEMLRADGHRVTAAVDGRDGVARALVDRYDVILMDISMPGMDGVEAATAIRSDEGPNRRTPIVATTAHAMPDEIARFRDAGMARTLTKPIDRAALRALLACIAPHSPASVGPQAADPAPPEGPLIDHARFADLPEIMGEDRFLQIVAQFLEEGDALAKAATPPADPADPDDPKRFVAQMHSLAGAAGLLGAQALHSALVDAEAQFKRDSAPVPETTRAQLAAVWAETRAVFDDLLAEGQG